MLTSDLLATRISKGKIEPVYALLDQDTLEIARSVISIFMEHVGRTYGELVGELEGIEEINYRLIRGLAQILERRCIIDIDSIIDPVQARRMVYEECRGFVTDKRERRMVLDKIAGKLSTEPESLEKALWADQENNLVLKEFRSIEPDDLIRHYNLSLAQTLLFRATGMEIQIMDSYQPVFRKIKQLGLIYSIENGKISLEGPISLFKLTERYGTAFAKLLPAIMQSGRWSLKASVSRKTFSGKRIYEFSLDHTKRSLFGIESQTGEGEVGFDSAIEKKFYQLSFNGWSVKREPAVLQAGQYAFIPDFSLERDGMRVYVEIIGFWTPEYLKHKIQKLNQLEKDKSIILLVNRKLACTGSEFRAENVLFYDRKIPQLEIIKILRRYEERQKRLEIIRLDGMDILSGIDKLSGSGEGVISLDEVAKDYGIGLDALREVVKGQGKPGYSLLGDQLVDNRVLKAIQGDLTGVKKHSDALKIFGEYGIKATSQTLSKLGYQVKWSGLNPDNAEIILAN